MQGYNTLWLPGMDHAGIATQNVVERELAKEGLSRHDLGREAFVERVWQWKAESGGKILGQMRRLGDSVDWSRERFTMDEGLSRAVQTIFKRLFDDGLIYRAERIINWCPRCLTALSDIEVDHSDDDGELVSIRYGGAVTSSIVVATTRAETMLGDTAVAVHPDDERYTHLVGKTVELPLTGRRIPVVADEHVDPAFGTGAVKVTPAHDPNDFEIGRRHDLPSITVLDEHGVITAHGPFQGLDRFEARPAVVRALREQGRIVAEKSPVRALGRALQPLRHHGRAAPVAAVVRPRRPAGQGRGRRRPRRPRPAAPAGDERQVLRLGGRHARLVHQPPAVVGSPHPGFLRAERSGDLRRPGRAAARRAGRQDPDVLDTWFSSALWPFSTLGWPDDTADLRTFYPNSVLVTGYDILFFWVARMMMFGLYAMRDKAAGRRRAVPRGGPARAGPGPVRQEDVQVAREHGGPAGLGGPVRGRRDQVHPGPRGQPGRRHRHQRGVGGRVPQLLQQAVERRPLRPAQRRARPAARATPARHTCSVPDRWILSRLAAVIAEMDELFEAFEFGKVCDVLYHFAWDEVCDWYLELAKVPLASGDPGAAETTRQVLGYVLDQLLRLLHPVMPFVTEELWTALTGEESVMVAAWPTFSFADPAAEAEISSMMRLVTEVRRFRSDQGLRPSQRVAARLVGIEATPLAGHEERIRSLLRLTPPADGFTASASLEVEGVTVQLDVAGVIDVAAERRRMEKDLAAARAEAEQAERKLGNAGFTAKAPAAVVDKTRQRLEVAQADIARLEQRLASI